MAKLKILVADDAAFIRDMVRKTLRSRFPDFTVDEAINGRKAQQLLSRTPYDLILCDWEMPEMSGIELLTWLRKEQQATTPFVMVTSRGDKANVVEAIQAGVSDYIGKPFSRDKLLGKVIKVLGKHHDIKSMESPSSGIQGVAAGSLDALTAKKAVPAKANAPQPAATPSTAPPAAPAMKGKGPAHLRFADHVNQCVIKAISLKQIVLICRAQDGLPAILENVVVDLQQGAQGGDVARINGYVHQLQASESSMNSSLVLATINFVDQDPNKLAYISKMIAKGSTSAYVPGA